MSKTYVPNQAKKKRQVRDYLFNLFPRYNNIIGLAGPNVQEYMYFCKKHGFKNIQSYETDEKVLKKQMKYLPIPPIFGDILEARPNLPDTFYDLDFCCKKESVQPHILKLMKVPRCIATFSLMFDKKDTVKTVMDFIELKGETIKDYKLYDRVDDNEYIKVVTNKGIYIYSYYCDTSPMCCIAKIK